MARTGTNDDCQEGRATEFDNALTREDDPPNPASDGMMAGSALHCLIIRATGGVLVPEHAKMNNLGVLAQ